MRGSGRGKGKAMEEGERQAGGSCREEGRGESSAEGRGGDVGEDRGNRLNQRIGRREGHGKWDVRRVERVGG